MARRDRQAIRNLEACLQRRQRPKSLTQQLAGGKLLLLPLCPSTNARMKPTTMFGGPRSILTDEAREYIDAIAWLLKSWCKRNKHTPIDNFAWFDLWFILPRTTCDAHNYGKVLFDAMERGGIVTNDRYILPRIQGVWHDKDTWAIIKIPDKPQPKAVPAPARKPRRKPIARGRRK